MAVFLGVHKIPSDTTDEDVKKNYEAYKKSAMEAGIKPLGAVASVEKGFAYCQTEAESADEVRDAHEKAQVPLEDVVMVISLA